MARDKEIPSWYRHPGPPRADPAERPFRSPAGPRKRPNINPSRNRPKIKPPRYVPERPETVPERPARPAIPKAKPPAIRSPKLPKVRVPFLPWDNPFWEFIERAPEIIWPNPDANIPPILPSNYVWCKGPVPWAESAPHFTWISAPFWGYVGSCTIDYPQYGQPFFGSDPEVLDPNKAIREGVGRANRGRGYHLTNTEFNRRYDIGTIEKIAEPVGEQAVPYQPVISFAPARNPNIDRWLPTFPDPFAPPRLPSLEPGYGTPLVQPAPFANPELPYQPDYGWGWEASPGLDTPVDLAPGQPSSPSNPVPPVTRPRLPPVQRQPPRKREKQRKVITKTKAIGIALYKALDAASESAEIVDALFDALPDDVKKRWKRAERVGDNFGQYGPDGADWKLQALYWNWHKLDVVQAVKNIIKNELEDRIIGGMHQGQVRNTGNALESSEKALAKRLDRWFEEEFGI